MICKQCEIPGYIETESGICNSCFVAMKEQERKMEGGKVWVFISGPYTKGDQAANTANAIRVGKRLREQGYVPVIPHLFHFAHFMSPADYDFWTEWDLDLLERCDWVYRLRGDSPGADREVERAIQLGKPIMLQKGDDPDYVRIHWNLEPGWDLEPETAPRRARQLLRKRQPRFLRSCKPVLQARRGTEQK